MSNKNSNYPSNKLNELNGSEYTGEVVGSLIELSRWGIPQNEAELSDRIDRYFEYCGVNNLRPGVESFCLSLGITRQTLNNWVSGKTQKSDEWINLIILAKQTIFAFIETASLSGKLNPATTIFCLKNWAGYSDTKTIIEIEKSQDAQKDYASISRYRLGDTDNADIQ